MTYFVRRGRVCIWVNWFIPFEWTNFQRKLSFVQHAAQAVQWRKYRSMNIQSNKNVVPVGQITEWKHNTSSSREIVSVCETSKMFGQNTTHRGTPVSLWINYFKILRDFKILKNFESHPVWKATLLIRNPFVIKSGHWRIIIIVMNEGKV
jgi:hypothetical protein